MDLTIIGIQTNFSWLDWCIVGGYLLIVVGIGVYIRRYVTNATDFIVAGRGLKTFLGVATMIGTELGLITVMYSAQKGFTGGFAAFHIALAAAAFMKQVTNAPAHIKSRHKTSRLPKERYTMISDM